MHFWGGFPLYSGAKGMSISSYGSESGCTLPYEIFVFDMGEPVNIVDLAKRMALLSGAKNVDIKFTGLRDGEKLFEEVLNDAELFELSQSYRDMDIVKKMKEIVPEYKSQHSKYQKLNQYFLPQ